MATTLMVRPTTGCQANGRLPTADRQATPYSRATNMHPVVVATLAATRETTNLCRMADQLATGRVSRSRPTIAPSGAPTVSPHTRALPTRHSVVGEAALPRLAASSARFPAAAAATQKAMSQHSALREEGEARAEATRGARKLQA